MNKLIDINEVCKMFGTTSRTLRFYEDKGIIQSTKVINSNRRKYSESQIEQIRNVLVLRALGLSVKSISDLQRNDSDLKTAVLSKKAEIYASIDTKIKEINLLNEALCIIESGKDIFQTPIGKNNNGVSEKYSNIVNECTKGILNRNYTPLYNNFSAIMRNYLPENVFWSMWDDTVKVCGDFVTIENIEIDKTYPYIYYHYIRFEKYGIKLKYVFYADEINGLWTTYYEILR